MSRRDLKEYVTNVLSSSDLDSASRKLCRIPGRRVVNPLFSLLYTPDENLKWRAVTAMGAVVAHLADQDMEAARIIIRRIMWNLNDESGGIGWGSAEAMGEILARNKDLAGEYASILLSYAREDGNYQEHEMMQRGVLWGIGRLAQVRPEFIKNGLSHILPFLNSPDPYVRAHAVWITGMLAPGEFGEKLMELNADKAEILVWIDRELLTCRVKDLVKRVLDTPHG